MPDVFWAIFFSTFVLEDVALIGSLTLAAEHKLTLTQGFLACFLGISLGDIGLYLLGRGARSFQSRFPFLQKSQLLAKAQKIEIKNLSLSVFLCRFIPGTRLPVYLGAGFLKFDLFLFTLLTVVSVFLWVGVVYVGGIALIHYFQNHWLVLVLCLFFLFSISKFLLAQLLDPWKRKSLKYFWIKWTQFEFWPWWLFYPPVVFYYIYFSLKYRSFYLPMYANPRILHGGLVGESKWDFYQHLQDQDFTLKTFLIPGVVSNPVDGRYDLIVQKVLSKEISYPFILKPDMGQRGFGVRIIRSDSELQNYLQIAKMDLILQEYCSWQNEAGVFYYRIPGKSQTTLATDVSEGKILSITDKRFPVVVGDGERSLGDLILQDPRARIIANVYFSRHHADLDRVPKAGEVMQISECGNHCQGAIFLNGAELNSPQLLDAIARVAQQIPDFYIGRIDIRYESVEKLRQGQGFKIIEVNGAGSEATHIWDPSTSLLEAYKVLFQQWGLVFQIGAKVRELGLVQRPVRLLILFRDWFSLAKTKEDLQVSS